MSAIKADLNSKNQLTANGELLSRTDLEAWKCDPIDPSPAFAAGIKAHCIRFRLKEVDICGRMFLANGQPKHDQLFTMEDVRLAADRWWED